MNFVTIAILVVVLLVVVFTVMYLRARAVAKRHAEGLSRRTGLPAEQILSEMTYRNQTPGEWAARHGLEPMTFLPRGTGLVTSQGEHAVNGDQFVVSVTDEAVYLNSDYVDDRWEYRYVSSARVERAGGSNQFVLRLVDGGEMYLLLDDPDAVATAISDQLEKLTKYTERVELLPNGGAVFRWRLVDREWMWWITFDDALLGTSGSATDKAMEASKEAIKELNKHIE